MKSANSQTDVFYLSHYPIPLTPAEVKPMLQKLDGNDEAAKKISVLAQ